MLLRKLLRRANLSEKYLFAHISPVQIVGKYRISIDCHTEITRFPGTESLCHGQKARKISGTILIAARTNPLAFLREPRQFQARRSRSRRTVAGYQTPPVALLMPRRLSSAAALWAVPRMDSRLAGGVHLVSRLHDVAHDDRGETSSGLRPARSTVALIVAAPSSVADTSSSAPTNVPTAVRTGLARTIAWDDLMALHISFSMVIGRSRTRLPVA